MSPQPTLENLQSLYKEEVLIHQCWLRSSPMVLSMWSSTVQLDEEKSKYVGLAQENGFGST
jgi:hypothetical protein